MQSDSKIFVIRLKPHEDLKRSVIAFAKENNIKAGIILSCAGSLQQFNLRFANQKSGSKKTGYFEIVSFSGTFSNSSAHLHIALSDSSGQTIGGHLLDENLIYTTAEIALAELSDLEFERLKDPKTGYAELMVRRKENS